MADCTGSVVAGSGHRANAVVAGCHMTNAAEDDCTTTEDWEADSKHMNCSEGFRSCAERTSGLALVQLAPCGQRSAACSWGGR